MAAGFLLAASLGALADDGPPTPQEMVGYGSYLARNAADGDNAALATLLSNSAHGDPGAEYGLGEYYRLTRDYERSIAWYRKAADQHFAGGYYALGVAFDSGRGVAADHAQAMRMYRAAADQLPAARTNIALLYAGGCGVPQDFAEAALWHREAAAAGSIESAIYLGSQYRAGRGVPQDDAEALRWYRRAADQHNALAELRLGLLYEESGSLQDLAQAARWYERAGQQGVADAQLRLGMLYAAGNGVPKDAARAINWLQMAANQGNGQAQFRLALSFANGEGVKPDALRALQWMQIAESALDREDPSFSLAAAHIRGSEQTMTPRQIELANRAAAEWLRTFAGRRRPEQPALPSPPCGKPRNDID